jgi:WXXGXW repeat (2 copies)
MNAKIRIFLSGAACVAAFAVAQSAFADTAVSSASSAAPAPGYVLMGGHWNSEGGQWKWAAAHWELPPSSSATWISGHWVPDAGKWTWVNGAWNISDGQQTQSGPPQPPQQPGALQDSQADLAYGPSPSTAAPYVDGQSGPSGVSRVIDQGEVVTDYGPVDYYPSYASYAWDGYPWAWGGPFIGFGFGGRFGGYGHYGYGHGGHIRGGGGAHLSRGGSSVHFGGRH